MEEQETSKVLDFTKRFNGTGPTATPPAWEITYCMPNGDVVTEEATGYISSLMPFLMITDKENGATPNNAVFSLPADRIVRYKRAQN